MHIGFPVQELTDHFAKVGVTRLGQLGELAHLIIGKPDRIFDVSVLFHGLCSILCHALFVRHVAAMCQGLFSGILLWKSGRGSLWVVTRDSWYNALMRIAEIAIILAAVLVGAGFTLVSFCGARLAARERRKVK